ncbi:dTMP kinase [Allohahella marinimesophila]|uniref:Thymidylate kinase n=1 Tax=Allohahella marinimesophila TaxID=1054972 RepID=A0ABP7NPV6_9GAMM
MGLHDKTAFNAGGRKGLFVTIEGTEGAGKSTNQRFIAELLGTHGQVEQTREPGGTSLGEELRSLLLQVRPDTFRFSAMAELLMIFAARAQHVEEKILPALEAGVHVVSDRFTDATYAYQGAARGLDLAVIRQLEISCINDLQPDLTVFLKVDAATGLERVQARGARDRFEQEKISFFESVQQGYLRRAEQFPGRFIIIDANQSLAKVQSSIAEAIERVLGQS